MPQGAIVTDELWFSDPTTHFFLEILGPRAIGDKRTYGVYRQRLNAANLKLRFAAHALQNIASIVRELEIGEFIYFDDASRLKVSFNLEAFVVFMRAALDATVSAYATYFTGKSSIDSVNDVIGKWPVDWVSPPYRAVWDGLKSEYDSETFNWVHALVGRDKGMSLRDLVVHKSILFVDTIIDDRDKGRFVLALDKETVGPLVPWVETIFDRTSQFVAALRDQIQDAEASPVA
jgi:hypothetical protein